MIRARAAFVLILPAALCVGCPAPDCRTACEGMVDGCALAPFSDVETCVDACDAAERGSPRRGETLGCYAAAGCSIEAVVACARSEQSAGVSP